MPVYRHAHRHVLHAFQLMLCVCKLLYVRAYACIYFCIIVCLERCVMCMLYMCINVFVNAIIVKTVCVVFPDNGTF